MVDNTPQEKRLSGLVMAALIIAVPLIILGITLLWGGQTPYAQDIFTLHYPLHEYVFNLSENWGFWCPYIFNGFPLAAQGEAGVFYPLNHLLLGSIDAISFLTISHLFHLWLVGMGVYLAAWEWLRQIVPAIVAGLIVALLPFSYGQLVNINYIASVAWFPYGLYGLLCYHRNGTIPPLLFTGMTLALSFLAGHSEVAIMNGLILCLLALALYRTNHRRLIAITVLLLTGFSLAGMQLLPLLQWVPYTHRWTNVPNSHYILQLIHLPTILVPRLLGNLGVGQYLGPKHSEEWFSLYVGMTPLLLFVVGLFAQRRDRIYYVVVGGLTVTLLLAFGNNGGLGWVLNKIPPFSMFRGPVRYLFYALMFAALLAARGICYWRKNGLAVWMRRFGVISALGLLLLSVLSFSLMQGPAARWVTAAYQGENIGSEFMKHKDTSVLEHYQAKADYWLRTFTRSAAWSGVMLLLGTVLLSCRGYRVPCAMLIIILIAADLLVVNLDIYPSADRDIFLRPSPFSKYLSGREGEGGIIIAGLPLHPGRPSTWQEYYRFYDTADIREIYQEYRVALEGCMPVLASAISPLGGDLSLAPRNLWYTTYGRVPLTESYQLLRNLGVRMIVSSDSLVAPAQPVAQEGALTLYELPGDFSLYNLPYGGRVRCVYVNENEWQLRVLTEQADRIRLPYTYHPDWQAYAGGQQHLISQAEGNGMVIDLPAGAYQLCLRFYPNSIIWGGWLSGLSAALLLFGLCFLKKS